MQWKKTLFPVCCKGTPCRTDYHARKAIERQTDQRVNWYYKYVCMYVHTINMQTNTTNRKQLWKIIAQKWIIIADFQGAAERTAT